MHLTLHQVTSRDPDKPSPAALRRRRAHIIALATDILGDRERAIHWLNSPIRALGHMTPRKALETDAGFRQVENVLGRIAYGGIS
jgi:putative toxin-antitoxin system antitoxin component (TIGR02293 family)